MGLFSRTHYVLESVLCELVWSLMEVFFQFFKNTVAWAVVLSADRQVNCLMKLTIESA